MNKIGTKKALGIITCKRPEFYQEIIDNTPFNYIDKVYVFDSSPTEEKYVVSNDKVELIPYEGDACVGIAKNKILSKMKEDGFDHFFLQEGDVKLLDGEVFNVYIETAKQSGLWGSLNYAWHGNGNKEINSKLKLKNSIQLGQHLEKKQQ
jgi:hypothetical protein